MPMRDKTITQFRLEWHTTQQNPGSSSLRLRLMEDFTGVEHAMSLQMTGGQARRTFRLLSLATHAFHLYQSASGYSGFVGPMVAEKSESRYIYMYIYIYTYIYIAHYYIYIYTYIYNMYRTRCTIVHNLYIYIVVYMYISIHTSCLIIKTIFLWDLVAHWLSR